MRVTILVAVMTLALDQLSKWLVLHFAPFGAVFRIDERLFCDLVLVYNRGITFGLLASSLPSQAILGGITALCGLAILVWGLRVGNLPLAMVAGGALGNSVDRFNRGGVVDFIDIYWRGSGGDWHWPAFNLADAAIVLGVLLLLFVAKPERRL